MRANGIIIGDDRIPSIQDIITLTRNLELMEIYVYNIRNSFLKEDLSFSQSQNVYM
jgi:hypothetical protein